MASLVLGLILVISDKKYMKSSKVRVIYLGYIRHIVGKKDEEIFLDEGSTVEELLQILEKNYGDRFTNMLRISDEKLSGGVIVLINGNNINQMDGLRTKISGEVEAQIVVMSPLGGG